MQRWVVERDVNSLARVLCGATLTPGQAEIAAPLAFGSPRRVAVSAHTRYGKTFSAGTGLAIRVIVDPAPRKILMLGPTEKQARLLRKEFIAACFRSPLARRQIGLRRGMEERMRRQLSRDHFDFRDGKSATVLSAADDADRIMGFGADVIVADEHALMTAEAHAKILRMLGDNPTESQLVVMSNPWDKSSPFGEAWDNPAYVKIHVNWQRGLREGRITQELVDEMRDMPPSLFRVFYESDFPDSSPNQLYPNAWIDRAVRPSVIEEHARERDAMKGPPPAPVSRYGLDVARGGGDFTVLTHAEHDGTRWHVREHWKFDLDDTEAIADQVADRMPPRAEVSVDEIGIGAGVGDKLRRRRFSVTGVNVGAGPTRPATPGRAAFLNLKAELFHAFRGLLQADVVSIDPRLEHLKALKDDLRSYRSEIVGGKAKVVEEGGGSPDFGDSAVIATCSRGLPRRRLVVG